MSSIITIKPNENVGQMLQQHSGHSGQQVSENQGGGYAHLSWQHAAHLVYLASFHLRGCVPRAFIHNKSRGPTSSCSALGTIRCRVPDSRASYSSYSVLSSQYKNKRPPLGTLSSSLVVSLLRSDTDYQPKIDQSDTEPNRAQVFNRPSSFSTSLTQD